MSERESEIEREIEIFIFLPWPLCFPTFSNSQSLSESFPRSQSLPPTKFVFHKLNLFSLEAEDVCAAQYASACACECSAVCMRVVSSVLPD